MPKDCVLFGGYAGGNVGDEMALEVAIRDAKARFGSDIAVLTRAPTLTARLFPDVPVIHYAPVPAAATITGPSSRGVSADARLEDGATFRPSDQVDGDGGPLDWVQDIMASRQLYLVGGGYLNDLWDIYFSLLPAWIATLAGVPVATAPIGVGPFRDASKLKVTLDVLGQTSLTVRDQASLDICRSHGIDARLAPDDVFQAELHGEPTGARPPGEKRFRLGVCIYRQIDLADEQRFKRWWLSVLRAMRLNSDRVDIEGFCFHTYHGHDYETTRDLFVEAELGDAPVRPPADDFRQDASALARYDVVISSRYHAAMVGAMARIPSFSVADGPYYRAKQTAEWPHGLPPFASLSTDQDDPMSAVSDLRRALHA